MKRAGGLFHEGNVSWTGAGVTAELVAVHPANPGRLGNLRTRRFQIRGEESSEIGVVGRPSR